MNQQTTFLADDTISLNSTAEQGHDQTVSEEAESDDNSRRDDEARIPTQEDAQTVDVTRLTGDDLVTYLCREIAGGFVRRDGRYFETRDSSRSLSRDDVQQVSYFRIKEKYPNLKLDSKTISKVFNRSIVQLHDDPTQSIPIWNGIAACAPGNLSRLLPASGMASINSWSQP